MGTPPSHASRAKLDVVDAIAAAMFEGVHEADPIGAGAGTVMLDTPGSDVLWTQSQATLCAAIEASLDRPADRPRRSAVPAAFRAQFVAGALLSVLKWWLRAGMPHPPEQMATMFESLMPPLRTGWVGDEDGTMRGDRAS